MKKKTTNNFNGDSRIYKYLFWILLVINLIIACIFFGIKCSKAIYLNHRESIYQINQVLYSKRLDYYNLHTDINNSYHLYVENKGVGVKEVIYKDGFKTFHFSINKYGKIIQNPLPD